MNGDVLNKVLIEGLEVTDTKTRSKRYKVHGVQRLRDTNINVVLYTRIGKSKIKIMEHYDFIKNFDLVKKK